MNIGKSKFKNPKIVLCKRPIDVITPFLSPSEALDDSFCFMEHSSCLPPFLSGSGSGYSFLSIRRPDQIAEPMGKAFKN